MIFRDSQYVLDGAAGKAYEWRRRQWCLSTGPILDSDLWEVLLLTIDLVACDPMGVVPFPLGNSRQ